MNEPDFQRWLANYRRYEDPEVDEQVAREAYRAYYNCACQGCRFRNEMGYAPVRVGPGCTVPLSRSELNEQVRRRMQTWNRPRSLALV